MRPMHSLGSMTGRMGQLRLFIASLWLTMATALFCAVVPVGLPHTAAHGSAFNPANSVVALHASGANRAVLKRNAVGDPAPGASAGSDIAVPAEQLAVAAPIPVAQLPVSAPQVAPRISHVPLSAYPRGPPSARHLRRGFAPLSRNCEQRCSASGEDRWRRLKNDPPGGS